MTRTWIAINVLLLGVAGLLGWQLDTSIRRFNADNDIAKIQPVRDVKQIPVGQMLPPANPPKRYNPGEFDIIPAQNLFSETRSREEKVETAPVIPESPPLDVKPVLVGVTISGDQRYALVVEPAAANANANAAGSRRAQRRKLGDTYRGYTITDITQNSMVLQSGNRREVIPLFDGAKHPGPGGKTAILATRVVAFAPGGSGPGAASGIQPAQSAAAVPVRNAPAAASPVVPVGTNQPAAAGQAGIARGVQQQPQPQQARPVPGANTAPSWNERVDEQGRRVIRTPFGDIVRPNQPNP